MTDNSTHSCCPPPLESAVTHGKHLGSRLGFPTANQCFLPGHEPNTHGIYASTVEIDGTAYPAVSNIGTRPTVDGVGVNCESYIIGYEGDLYGKVIRTTFLAFLRPEMKFGSVEALKAQIGSDVEAAKVFFSKK